MHKTDSENEPNKVRCQDITLSTYKLKTSTIYWYYIYYTKLYLYNKNIEININIIDNNTSQVIVLFIRNLKSFSDIEGKKRTQLYHIYFYNLPQQFNIPNYTLLLFYICDVNGNNASN